jgi:hypothetical protein
MSCSKAYMDLVVTSGGQTPDNQTGFYPTPYDYDEWLALARRLGLRVAVHLARLDSVSATDEERSTFDSLSAEAQALRDQYDELPSVWTCCFLEQQTIRAVGDAAALSVQTACLMEQVDKAIEARGSSVPAEPTPFTPATPPRKTITNAALLLALGAGAYLYLRSR